MFIYHKCLNIENKKELFQVSTIGLHTFCLEVLTVHGNELHLLCTKTFPYQCYAIDIAAVDITFNFFNTVWAKNRIHYLPGTLRECTTCYATVA